MLRLFVVILCLVLCIPFFFPRKSPQQRLEYVIHEMRKEDQASVERIAKMKKALVKLNADMERVGVK